MYRKLRRGATSQFAAFFVVDKSASPPAPMSGLTAGTSGLSFRYWRPGDASSTAVALAAESGGHAAGSFAAVSGIPGLYRVGIPDEALAEGDVAYLSLQGAADMWCPPVAIELDAVDYQDADGFGLSRLDAAVGSRLAPTAAGRTLDVSAGGGAGVDWSNVEAQDAEVDLSGTTIAGGAGGGGISVPENFAALDIDAQGRVAVATVADKSGYSLAADQAFSTTGSVGSVTGSVGSVTGSVGSVASTVVVGAYTAGASPEARLLMVPTRKLAVASDGSVAAVVVDKTGFALGADGLNMISVVDPGPPVGWNTLPKVIAGVSRHLVNRRVLQGAHLTIYKDDGVTPSYRHVATDDGEAQVLGAGVGVE